jgi:HK97 family phage major capsid protein
MGKIAELEARKKQLFETSEKSQSVVELRSINEELEQINAKLAELRKGTEEPIAGGNTLSTSRGSIPPVFMSGVTGRAADAQSAPVGNLRSVGSFLFGQRGGENAMPFNSPEEERRSTPEYREACFALLQGKGTPEQRDMVTTATGTAIIPQQTFNEVIANAQKAQGILSRVRVLNIPGKLSVPQSEINTPAAWHVEGTEIADSTLPPDSVVLTGHELAKLFSMSAATQAMSLAAFEKYLIEELTRTTQEALNAAIFNGSGSGQPLGILNAFTWSAANSVSVGISPAWDSLVKAMALLPANFRQNAVFTMNSVMFYSYVAAQTDANGLPIFSKDLALGTPMTLLGKPIVIDDFCPDNTIIFGDPMYYFYNFPQSIAVERSGEAGFTKATIMYRSLAVVDGKPVAPAFIKITKPAA